MGQILAGYDDMLDSETEGTSGMGGIRQQALDAKRVAQLSWLEFVEYINLLNKRCKQMTDDQGKHLVFAVRKGSTDSYLWKATVQIACIKFNTITKKVEAYKSMNLSKFLRVYSSIIDLLDDKDRMSNGCCDGERAGGSSCNGQASSLIRERDFTTSVILERVNAFTSMSSISKESSEGECSVCMERSPDVVLPCSHAYCLPCIEQWNVYNQDCPTCRADFPSTDDAWIISDFPDKKEFTDYLMKLADN